MQIKNTQIIPTSLEIYVNHMHLRHVKSTQLRRKEKERSKEVIDNLEIFKIMCKKYLWVQEVIHD